MVVNKDIYATYDLIGKAVVPMAYLNDQMKHDDWFDLENAAADQIGQSLVSGTIHL